jgi:regulation of enolase protein 1 (concanavalin A-like superfamily)
MHTTITLLQLTALLLVAEETGGTLLFEDRFQKQLKDGWSWVREDRAAWRLAEKGLEVKTQPGNMWGGSNDAKNLLKREAPAAGDKAIEVEVTVTNAPTGQYEQAGITWYHDDSNMVKLVKEQVDGKVHVVMGREEGDKTRTIALVPQPGTTFQLRFSVKDGKITGSYKVDGKGDWKEAGTCELPAAKGKPQICLQTYNGPADAAHWARFSELRVRAR